MNDFPSQLRFYHFKFVADSDEGRNFDDRDDEQMKHFFEEAQIFGGVASRSVGPGQEGRPGGVDIRIFIASKLGVEVVPY